MFRLAMTNLKYLAFGRAFLVGAVGELMLGIIGGKTNLEQHFSVLHTVLCMCIITAVTVINSGHENSDGTLRNKLIIGYTRNKIYAAFTVSSLICSLVLFLLFSVPFYLIGMDAVGKNMPDEQLLMSWLTLLFITAAVTVVGISLTVCVSSASVVFVVLLGAGIGLAALGGLLANSLSERKYSGAANYSAASEQVDNVDSFSAEQDIRDLIRRNEKYTGGFKRTLYRSLYLLDPYGQLRELGVIMDWYRSTDVLGQLNSLKNERPELFEEDDAEEEYGYYYALRLQYFPIWSMMFSSVIYTAGLLVFRKRNIN